MKQILLICAGTAMAWQTALAQPPPLDPSAPPPEAGVDRDRALEELRGVLSKAFDMRESLRRERLSRMQERLVRAQTLLDERASNRTAIIERRLRELIRDDPTAW